VLDDERADDLKFADPISSIKSPATAAILAPFVSVRDAVLEAGTTAAFSSAVTIAGGGPAMVATALGLCALFFTRGGKTETLDNSSAAAAEAKTNSGFTGLASDVQRVLDPLIARDFTRGLIDDRAIAREAQAKLSTRGFFGSRFVGEGLIFIGGVQGYRAKMCNLTVDTSAKSFTYSIDLTIFDHFGVDDADVNRPDGNLVIGIGNAPFFVLQHQKSALPTNLLLRKYRPFRVELNAKLDPHTGTV